MDETDQPVAETAGNHFARAGVQGLGPYVPVLKTTILTPLPDPALVGSNTTPPGDPSPL